jgi:RimJ/RimL family protein N-acetyltransferase
VLFAFLPMRDLRDPCPVPTRLDAPMLHGTECWLRPWRLDDAPALREACGDEGICRFTTVPLTYSHEAALRWIRRQQQHAANGHAIVLAIVPVDGTRPVGMVGLFGLDELDHAARVGYWLISKARRQGLATAAARLLADWAFASLGIHEIFIDHEPDNRASARVAEHLGATHLGSHPRELRGSEVKLERHALTH